MEKNILRSQIGTRFKSQSISSKSRPSVNFGPSHRVVDFRPDVGQLLVNPVPEKKASFIAVLVAAKQAISLKIVRFPLPQND